MFAINYVIYCVCGEFDKYGRLLVDIYILDDQQNKIINISDYLIENNYAFKYTGGTKESWSDYLDKNKINFE
jgi:hypothetical protein